MARPPRAVTDNDDRDDIDALAARLAAVERAVADGEHADGTGTAAGVEGQQQQQQQQQQQRFEAVADDVETLTERVDALEATVQSLHGYVGELEHVNERVERRADAARAAVERLEEDRPNARPPGRHAPDGEPASRDVPATSHDGHGDSDGDPGLEDRDRSVLDRLRSSL